MSAMFRQSVYGKLGGYEDLNDAERLCVDPTMRHVVGGRAIDKSAASTSEMGRVEICLSLIFLDQKHSFWV